MSSDNTPDYTKDGLAIVDKRIADAGEELKALTERKNSETSAELRDEFSKQIEELAIQVTGLTEEAAKTRAALVPGVEVGGGEEGKFSFARYLQAGALAAKSRTSNPWEEKRFGIENDYRQEMQKRVESGVIKTYTGASDSAGGYLIGTEVQAGIIDLARPQSIAAQAGVRRLDGLSSNISFVRTLTGPQVYWIDTEAEDSITESTGSFTNVNAKPHPMAALSKMTWGMLNQPSESIDAHIKSELSTVLTLAEDGAIFTGTGVNGQPLGVFNTPNVSTNALAGSADTLFGIGAGTPSLATSEFSQNYFRSFGQTLRSSNTMNLPGSKLAWVFENDVAEDVEACVTGLTGEPLFLKGDDMLITQLMRKPIYTSSQLTNSGSDRRAMFGDWNQVVVPHWGALELRVAEEGDDFKKARMSVRIIQSMDVVVLQPTALVKATTYAD